MEQPSVGTGAKINMRIKENEKSDKYLGLARELRKLWGIRMTVIFVVIDRLRLVSKVLERSWKS